MTTTTSVLLALAVLPLAADAHGYRDPSDPLIGTWPQIIVCREPSARRNLRGEAKA